MEELLDILAHGDSTQVAARVFDSESLTEEARGIPIRMLQTLRAPSPDAGLEVVERHPSGEYELVILRVPWEAKTDEPGSGYHPLLVAEQGNTLRAVGFVLPWNEVMPQIGEGMASIMPLALIWITRLAAFQSRGMSS